MCLHQHCVERLLARSLGELREERDVAAEHGLQCGASGSEYRSGSDDDTTYNPVTIHYSKSCHIETCGCHVGGNFCRLRTDDGWHELSGWLDVDRNAKKIVHPLKLYRLETSGEFVTTEDDARRKGCRAHELE